MKYYIISGEASGDLHGANLIKALRKKDPEAEIRAWGGDLMEAAGAKLVKHYRDLAFMGFAEVLFNIRTILKNISFCKRDLTAFAPDVLILIDYPGFNLRIAAFAKKQGITVFYYISPQIWAWKQSRVFQIRKVVDKMFVILPFEKDFYKAFGMEVEFVGHPLLDAVEARLESKVSLEEFCEEFGLPAKPIVAILPGSRRQEVKSMLPLMLRMTKHYPRHQFVIAAAPSLPEDFYRTLIKDFPVSIISNATYRLLAQAEAAMVTSGTATLETALFGVPEVVCYKGNVISYHIAKKLVKVKYISLVNLIMEREVVTELIQNQYNEINLRTELDALLYNTERKERLKQDYLALKEKLGGAGASEHTADLMFKTLLAAAK